MSASRVVVGLSGGVDSAVSAWLLKEQGHEVIGLFMKNWEDDDDSEYCSSRQDWIDAASVADVLGIELEAVNFAAEYRERVFAEFLREYSVGRTPNPDVLCNAEIKFKAFLDHAMRLGADRIGTGHYARVRAVPDDSMPGGMRHELLRGLDATKDQSYFLHRLTQAQLARTVFPVGELPKREVRQIAERIGLPNHAKRIRPASASSASARSGPFSTAICRRRRARSSTTKGVCLESMSGWLSTPSGSARAWASAGKSPAAARPGMWPERTWMPTHSMWCRVMTIPG